MPDESALSRERGRTHGAAVCLVLQSHRHRGLLRRPAVRGQLAGEQRTEQLAWRRPGSVRQDLNLDLARCCQSKAPATAVRAQRQQRTGPGLEPWTSPTPNSLARSLLRRAWTSACDTQSGWRQLT